MNKGDKLTRYSIRPGLIYKYIDGKLYQVNTVKRVFIHVTNLSDNSRWKFRLASVLNYGIYEDFKDTVTRQMLNSMEMLENAKPGCLIFFDVKSGVTSILHNHYIERKRNGDIEVCGQELITGWNWRVAPSFIRAIISKEAAEPFLNELNALNLSK